MSGQDCNCLKTRNIALLSSFGRALFRVVLTIVEALLQSSSSPCQKLFPFQFRLILSFSPRHISLLNLGGAAGSARSWQLQVHRVRFGEECGRRPGPGTVGEEIIRSNVFVQLRTTTATTTMPPPPDISLFALAVLMLARPCRPRRPATVVI